MLVLDLFCGAGGAAMGYAQAGFEVIGVDVKAQPHFPFPFVQADALDVLVGLLEYDETIEGAGLADIDLIHASPPCQKFTAGNRVKSARNENPHPDLLAPTRELLWRTGVPYVIENVPGAPLLNPMTLCGRMFDLGAIDTDGTPLILDRHRLFETSFPLTPPRECRPHKQGVQVAGVYDGARRDKTEAREIRKGGYVPGDVAVLRDLMGIDWMGKYELFLAIPPAYTRHIAEQWIGLQ